MLEEKMSQTQGKLQVLRSEQCVRSRQYRGVIIRVIHEGPSIEVLRTEMEAGTALDHIEFGDFRALHFVEDGSAVFRCREQAADLMPGDSIAFGEATPYTISNRAPSRSVILSMLFKKEPLS
jgi:hypothetical protein